VGAVVAEGTTVGTAVAGRAVSGSAVAVADKVGGIDVDDGVSLGSGWISEPPPELQATKAKTRINKKPVNLKGLFNILESNIYRHSMFYFLTFFGTQHSAYSSDIPMIVLTESSREYAAAQEVNEGTFNGYWEGTTPL